MSRTLRMLGTLAVLGMLAAGIRPANAAQIQLNGNKPYLCVAVQGSSTADGTAVIAYSCSGGRMTSGTGLKASFKGWARQTGNPCAST